MAGTIETEKVEPTEIEEPGFDQEHTVIIVIDDEWLERLDLPVEQ